MKKESDICKILNIDEKGYYLNNLPNVDSLNIEQLRALVRELVDELYEVYH